MANEFDHIEDSLRNAFESFELPVSNTDWEKISSGLNKSTKRKPVLWFNTSLFRIILGLVLIASVAGLVFVLIHEKNAEIKEPKSNTFIGKNLVQNEKGSASATVADRNKNESGPATSTLSKGTTSNLAGASKQKLPDFSAPDNKTAHGFTAKPAAASASVPKNPDPVSVGTSAGSKPEPIKPAATPDASGTAGTPVDPPKSLTPIQKELLQAFQIKRYSALSSSLAKAAIQVFPLLNTLKTGLEWYAGVQVAYAKAAINQTKGSTIWDGVRSMQLTNDQITLRLESGFMYKLGNWKVGIGAALDGTAATSSHTDTIRIKVADRFFPYLDVNGNVLFWLATRWKDSILVLRRNQKQNWLELPVSMQRSFNLPGRLKLIAGFSVNPGVLTGSSGAMVNPYVYQSGSYWQYNQGIQADTTNLTSNVSDWLNSYRLGTGLTLGVEKQLGAISLGAQANLRYYFTNAWKQGVPLKETNSNFGINFRIGYKF